MKRYNQPYARAIERQFRMGSDPQHQLVIIGGGPAGLYAARELAINGVSVAVINRDIKPGGLAEYGIYPDKLKMKDGLRAQFRQILGLESIRYYGNVSVGVHSDLRLNEFREMGFQAILVTVGAQGTKWLGLPGEQFTGVYHAKNLVYHYNRLPPFSEQNFAIGCKVAVVGAGNVMGDVVHYLTCEARVDEVYTVARRGPAEIKFDKKEMEVIIAHLDIAGLEKEIDRVAPMMRGLGQDPEASKELFRSIFAKGTPACADTHFMMDFLASPTRILGDVNGKVSGLEVENNTLVLEDGQVKARGSGTYRVLDVDTVIFAIGDAVDSGLGLPISGGEFSKNPSPRFPIDGNSYEAYDSKGEQDLSDIFVAWWARKASTGLVGIARRDGTNGAKAILEYLATRPVVDDSPIQNLEKRLNRLDKPSVKKECLGTLLEAEHQQALQLGVEDFRFKHNQEMLTVMGLS
jgi:ferredoxin--NADP+ reductase